MPSASSSFLDKVLGRIGRLDEQGLQTVIQRLARERTFLETLFNAIDDGVLVVDELGHVLYANRAVTRLLGLPPQSVEGRPIRDVLPELDWAKWGAADRAGGTRVGRQEIEISYPEARYLSLYVAPLDSETAGGSGVAIIIHDATEARKQTFEAIESERIQALTLLAASVAHEIGNPLNALSIHLQLTERQVRKCRLASLEPPSKPPPPQRRARARTASGPSSEILEIAGKMEQYLAVCKGEVTRLDYIVTQFLQAIRPSPPQLRPVSLNRVVEETLALLGPEIENRGLVLRRKLDAGLPAVPLDPAQMKQVLVNLVKNALQAMSKGGTLTLETGRATDGVCLTVADTGGGIAPDRVQRLFEPFYTTRKKGTGLGLMIVQRIIREHQGRIGLESRLGKGTTFRVWLPLQEPQRRLLHAGALPSKDS
ncbi:MAG: PAS domain-containing protein [Verrucomicrobia bacterium]|nr:PAS domain-containing protein [Verrucomicrobiota bacterium]